MIPTIQEYNTQICKEKIEDIYKNEYCNGMSMGRLSKKYGVSSSYFSRWFKKLNFPARTNEVNSRKYTFDYSYFDSIDTQDKAYWLGFIFADGYIVSAQKHGSPSLGIALSVKDILHLAKFRVCINGDMPIKTYTTSGGYSDNIQYCRILLKSNGLVNALKKQGVIERKSNILLPPAALPEGLIRHFIRGYFDGDGSVWMQTNKKGVNIQYNVGFTGTYKVLQYIQDYLFSKDVIKRYYSITKRKPEHIVGNFKFGGNHNTLRFLDHIYTEANIKLTRKFERYLQLKELVESRL